MSLVGNIKNTFIQRHSIVDMMSLFHNLICYNKLYKLGYEINEINREEIYLDIINKRNDLEITYLEEYLISDDMLKEVIGRMDYSKSVLSQIECINDDIVKKTLCDNYVGSLS